MIPAYTRVVAPGAEPTETALVLHGIMGSQRNWRAFARRLAAARPDWAFVLVDLRNHGDSQGFDGPHTIEACAADLYRLVGHLETGPRAVIGHSFGGKVALAVGRTEPALLEQVWALDSDPGAYTELPMDRDVVKVIEALRELPGPFANHERLRVAMVERGFSPGIAAWMTTNLKRGPEGLSWRFELDAIEEMLRSYASDDLWPWLESTSLDVRFVRGERSDRWTPEHEARIAAAPSITDSVLADAGHWVHVDAPEPLLALMTEALPSAR